MEVEFQPCTLVHLLSTLIEPPWEVMIPWMTGNPNPVPFPTSFVVKKGVNIFLKNLLTHPHSRVLDDE